MKTRVLVSVMTYPTLSDKHIETVCTAGFREDGSWIRIFPVPLRLLPTEDGQLPYRKWQWIEVDLAQDVLHDDRPESFHICDIDSLKAMERIEVKGKPNNWALRIEWMRKNKKVFTNMDEILNRTQRNEISLAVLKPREIKRVIVEHIMADDEYHQKFLKVKQKYEAELAQLSLFDEPTLKRNFVFAEKIPYRFRYVFTTDDGIERKIMIEDWEICQLYRNLRKKHDEETACKKVQEHYMMLAREKDIYLFMGTSFQWQRRKSKDPYLIIGVFYPPKADTTHPSLFD